jgi:hypothetical protein
LGGMLGIVPVVAWARRLEDGTGWEARVEARTLDGHVVGAAESMCSRDEQTWKRRDEYALRSMAQTRAISRALRAPLGQIVVLAGYEPAAAKEIPAESTASRERPDEVQVEPSSEQWAEITTLIRTLEGTDPYTDWTERAREHAGVPGRLLTRRVP